MIGNDGGLNISWDQGKTWDFVNTMATALAYWVSADMRRPYYVYIGLQDNGSWGGPSADARPRRDHELRLVRHRRRRRLPDGRRSDRLQHRLSPSRRTATTNRYDLRTGRGAEHPAERGLAARGRGGRGGGGAGAGGAAPVRPAAPEAAPAPPVQAGGQADAADAAARRTCSTRRPGDAYRFNWNTPFIMSPHNPSIVWLGGNRLFKSYNRGDTWVASADLTKQIDRNTVALMGVPGDRTQLSKNDGVVVLQHDHLDLGIAGDARRRVGRAPTTGTCR